MVIDSPVQARIESAQLSLFYLELTLLHFFGYTGVFVDRLDARWTSEVKIVPWRTREIPEERGEPAEGHVGA